MKPPLLASIGGLSLTALIGSADPNVAASLTLLAISAVALGGVSLAGGSGGLVALPDPDLRWNEDRQSMRAFLERELGWA